MWVVASEGTKSETLAGCLAAVGLAGRWRPCRSSPGTSARGARLSPRASFGVLAAHASGEAGGVHASAHGERRLGAPHEAGSAAPQWFVPLLVVAMYAGVRARRRLRACPRRREAVLHLFLMASWPMWWGGLTYGSPPPRRSRLVVPMALRIHSDRRRTSGAFRCSTRGARSPLASGYWVGFATMARGKFAAIPTLTTALSGTSATLLSPPSGAASRSSPATHPRVRMCIGGGDQALVLARNPPASFTP